ncbi:hypothetical protein FQN53_000482 [Emmonsiellopsis sp. PD_33]|nr:hypothetical protein FQN53_000482 [Emmonsiellopsis sp. PD_33]
MADLFEGDRASLGQTGWNATARVEISKAGKAVGQPAAERGGVSGEDWTGDSPAEQLRKQDTGHGEAAGELGGMVRGEAEEGLIKARVDVSGTG